MTDSLTRFVFEYAPVKGGIVQLDAVWRAVQGHADYPPPLRRVLGELLAAAALLTSNIKFDGTLILQLQGKGPVRLIVVEATSRKTLRATAKWTGDIPASDRLSDLLGQGNFAITLDQSQAGKQNYQGIVPMEGTTVAETLAHYMQSSEQLDTRIYLASGSERVAGMLLQRMPDQKSADTDAWNRATLLADTIKSIELLSLPPGDVLMRLFHEETLRQFDQEKLSFACTCSKDKAGNMLKMLGEEEVSGIVAEQGQVEVNCEFCDRQYRFDAVDVAQLFSSGTHFEVPTSRH
ncbi:MAG: Hsp33 family molecular chaperone HslO [Hydrogenophilaceae bacterium]|nr:Hsp33 family molecular chaperone HslO [Hydrogenophilaceae bacterium]